MQEHWAMLREARRIIKENEEGWKERRTGEIRKIKEQEKRERLAIVAEKKKKYGLNTLTKEEKRRLGERTNERIEIANARANYWKLHRGGSADGGPCIVQEEDEHADGAVAEAVDASADVNAVYGGADGAMAVPEVSEVAGGGDDTVYEHDGGVDGSAV